VVNEEGDVQVLEAEQWQNAEPVRPEKKMNKGKKEQKADKDE